MSMRHVILHNFWLKLFSFALATVLWLAIHDSIHDEQANTSLTPEYIRVPVAVKTPPGDKRVFRITPDEVVVTAVGKDPILFQTTQKDIHAVLDLTHFAAKDAIEKLRAESPADIIVLEVLPATVEVQDVSP
jgi:YbbR domain-containing protein